MSKYKPHLRWLAALAMVTIGITHFAWPAPFLRIIPEALPFPLALVYLSGGVEIACGLGLLHPRTRRLAAWGLVLLFIAVFPANINMAVNEIQVTPDGTVPVWAMWARLPLQLGLVAVAYWFTRPDPAATGVLRTGHAQPDPRGARSR